MKSDNRPALSLTRRAGDLVFVSGQIATDPATGRLVEGGLAAQTRQVIENIRRNLASVGLGLNDVVKTTVFLAKPQDFAEFNSVYREFFSEPYPTRSTVAVTLVSPDMLIEIEAIAAAKDVEPR